MRDRTPARFSRQNEAAFYGIAEAKHNSRSVKPTEHKRGDHGRQMVNQKPLRITTTPQASSKSKKMTQGQPKKNNMLKHYSTGNRTSSQRQTTPNRHRPRNTTPGLQTFNPNSQLETVSILKKNGRRSSFTRALSLPGEAEGVSIRVNQGRRPGLTAPPNRHDQVRSALLNHGQDSLFKSRSYDGSVVLAKSVQTETRPVFTAPTAFNIPDLINQMNNFFAAIQNLTCTGTSNPDTKPVAVVSEPVMSTEHAPAQGVQEEPGQLLSLGRSISLPFFGQTQANMEEITVDRGIRSIDLFPTIPEVRSEDEEDNIVRSLSGASLGLECRTTKDVLESRDEEKVEAKKGTEGDTEGPKTRMECDGTKKTEESHDTKKMVAMKDVKKSESRKVRKYGSEGTKVRVDGHGGEKTEALHDTKKMAVSKGAKKIPKEDTQLDKQELDYSVLELKQVASLVIDLAREESTRREVSRHPARVVRVSSRNENWRKRLVGNKNSKSGHGNGPFSSKKRIHV